MTSCIGKKRSKKKSKLDVKKKVTQLQKERVTYIKDYSTKPYFIASALTASKVEADQPKYPALRNSGDACIFLIELRFTS